MEWLILVVLLGLITAMIYRNRKPLDFTPVYDSPMRMARRYFWPSLVGIVGSGLVIEFMQGQRWPRLAYQAALFVTSVIGAATSPPRLTSVKAAMWISFAATMGLLVYATSRGF